MLEFSKIFIFPYISFGVLYLLAAYISRKLKNKVPILLSAVIYSHEHKWVFWIIAITYLFIFYALE